MRVTAVQPLPVSRRQQPGFREERRKKLEVFVVRKMAAKKQIAPDKPPEIRSPLMERSNRDLQKSEKIKPLEKKMVEPVNKENILPAVNKDGRNMTFTQSFMKTKSLNEKQMKDVKEKLESIKEDPKPLPKPVLGAYRGKIVQSKINSFRKNSENKNLPEQNKNLVRSEVKRPLTSVPTTSTARLRSANDVKPKRPGIPPRSSQTRPTKLSEAVTVRRTTQVQIQQKPQPVKAPLKNRAIKNNPVMQSKKIISSAPGPGSLKNKPAPKLPTASKFLRTTESAAEQKARLAEWRESKGKVIKRPPMAVVIPNIYSVPKEEPKIKTEPEEPEETPPLYWATMAEEDEQELFTLKVHQIFGGCRKLIDEGWPREEVISILEEQIQTVPEAKKLSGYWECLARLEKRDGQLYKVIAVCEEAVSAGAQPLEELRAILADALEQLKPDPEKSERKKEGLKTEVKDEPVETVKGKRRGGVGAVKSAPKGPSKSDSTPENGDAVSSVIKFNIRSTPHLEKMKKLQMNEGESSIQSYRFLTPVRRSSRLEHKSHRLPVMLQDHDPCVSGIDQLGDLEGIDSCPNAYIFRKNSALDVTTKIANQK
ncbi:cytoskeleton-associated protein 2 [Rhinoderma darwinii]|uniref:cytoskeleton-associated protein 2 n=1 Tax=Rhinoderma darwinii TaxID=43563 RepID=UPI003F68119E